MKEQGEMVETFKIQPSPLRETPSANNQTSRRVHGSGALEGSTSPEGQVLIPNWTLCLFDLGRFSILYPLSAIRGRGVVKTLALSVECLKFEFSLNVERWSLDFSESVGW